MTDNTTAKRKKDKREKQWSKRERQHNRQKKDKWINNDLQYTQREI